MDSGPRDLCRSDRIRHLFYVHVTCTGKDRVGHSPTRRKFQVLLRLNRGVDSPINFVTAPSITSLHVAPHTGAHVAAWPPCHVAAPLCASYAGHPGSATWPQCRVAPRGGPARHVSRRLPCQRLQVKTSFCDFFNKNQIKIQKFLKCSEIHISQNTTPFNLKFSPLDHKFLPF